MAQLMRFHQYPNDTNGIGKNKFSIKVDSNPWEDAWTRGGNGLGGPYNWSQMPLVPNDICPTITSLQRQAIGALCYDAGASTGMSYTAAESTTLLANADTALVNPFKYSNSIFGCAGPNGIGTPLIDMVNPNLDYLHPVIISITRGPNDPNGIDEGSGHAVLVDGYGYNLSTLYHHLNMGWEGSYDAWYNLPYVLDYNTVNSCVYNIFTSGSGEIISGRVTNGFGNPLSGATVTAVGLSGSYATTTNTEGYLCTGERPGSPVKPIHRNRHY